MIGSGDVSPERLRMWRAVLMAKLASAPTAPRRHQAALAIAAVDEMLANAPVAEVPGVSHPVVTAGEVEAAA